MATPSGTGRDRARQVRLLSSVTVFFLLSSFLLLAFTISFIANYSNRRGGTEWDETRQAATAMRDGTGCRRAGGGGRRRKEGGLAGNMGAAEAEGLFGQGVDNFFP